MPNLPAAFIRLRFPLSAFPHLSSLYTERSSEPRHDAAPTPEGALCKNVKMKNVVGSIPCPIDVVRQSLMD